MIVGLVTDLFFGARIRENAKQLGVPCELVRDGATFVDRAQTAGASVLIIDLNLKTGDPLEAVRAVRAQAATKSTLIIGFLFDVQEDLIKSAEAAGVDKVWSRGQFTKMLPKLLSERAATVPPG